MLDMLMRASSSRWQQSLFKPKLLSTEEPQSGNWKVKETVKTQLVRSLMLGFACHAMATTYCDTETGAKAMRRGQEKLAACKRKVPFL